MDPNRDNPFARFSAFWLGLGVMLIFAVPLVLFAMFDREQPDGPEEVAAAKRIETRKAVEAAQAEELSVEAIHAAIPAVAKELADSAPTAVEDNKWVVPGSETAIRIEQAAIDAGVMEMGKLKYLTCVGCHGQNGEGVATLGPPLAKSEWVTGPIENLIRIQLRGLTGPITVAGVEYNPVAPMVPLATQTDEEIAAVLTYVRNSWGNQASAVKPEQVKALRGEVGKPMLTVKDLIKP